MIVFIIIVFIWSCIPRSMMQSRTFQEIMIYSQWCGLASSMCSTFWGYLDNVTGNKAVAWWGNWLPCWWKEQEVPLQVASKWDERILRPFCNVLSGTAGAELYCLKTGLHSGLHRRFTVGLLSKGREHSMHCHLTPNTLCRVLPPFITNECLCSSSAIQLCVHESTAPNSVMQHCVS